MTQLAIYLRPAAMGTIEGGEDFTIEETKALSAYLPQGVSVLVPAGDLRDMVDVYAARKLEEAVEDAHMVLVVRR